MASVDLSSSVIDLDGVRDDAAAALVACLESRPGRKALVLDPHVGPTVMRVATMATLRAHDVDRLYYLEGGTLETTCSEVMFVVRPRLELMHKLAEVVASVRDDEAERRARRANDKNEKKPR
jgi:vacuolar protein sorting-associated protein 33A